MQLPNTRIHINTYTYTYLYMYYLHVSHIVSFNVVELQTEIIELTLFIALYGARSSNRTTSASRNSLFHTNSMRCNLKSNHIISDVLVILHHKRSVSHAHLCICHCLDPTPSEDLGYRLCHTCESDKVQPCDQTKHHNSIS